MSARPMSVTPRSAPSPGVLATWRAHWPEYAIEGWALGTFMISAAVVTTALEAPASPLRQEFASADVRRALIGVAMGLTAIALIYSPWGKRSGAHMNPAVTLAFYLLGRVAPVDAFGYVAAQFAGGLLGVVLAAAVLGPAFTSAPVSWVATVPGPQGAAVALVSEAAISFGLLSVVLALAGRARTAPYAGLAAGGLVAAYIAFEAPLSGMSMNPARTFASAAPAGLWADLWIYFVAPCAGMAAAAALHGLLQPAGGCAKVVHPEDVRCIHCGLEPEAAAVEPDRRTSR